MSYATQADLIDRFGEGEILDLADRDGDGTPDTDVVEGALSDAASLIDSYVGRRMRLPLDPVPEVLTRVACDLARYYLYEHRATDEVTRRHEAAMRYLRDIAEGKASLGADAPAKTTSGSPMVRPGHAAFDDDALRGY
ncbi:gp436 family protein [Thioalkalivibrio sp. ALMg9]|uniref:gp436 family protein n=1 Tax=Thioalkalivibrio sp. ALMg9 TaxID=1266912 RepID=UPI0003762D00|nr:DUF1320 domain-containing protein [Thioalkalivibrio sp. ALMg9]